MYQKGPFDLTIGTRDAAFHIGKSDLPFQRMFFDRERGLQFESFEGVTASTQQIEMPMFPTHAKCIRFVERLLAFVHRGTHTVVITFGNSTENLRGFGCLLERASACQWDYPGVFANAEIKDNVHKITLVTVVA